MGICPNAYYNYLKRQKAVYIASKADICREIESIYHETGGILGHRSMRIFLLRKGIILSKTTVFKYMNKELRLLCICRRRRPGYKKGQAHKIFPNLLNQHFEVTEKNKVWCTDFTNPPAPFSSQEYSTTLSSTFVSDPFGDYIFSAQSPALTVYYDGGGLYPYEMSNVIIYAPTISSGRVTFSASFSLYKVITSNRYYSGTFTHTDTYDSAGNLV